MRPRRLPGPLLIPREPERGWFSCYWCSIVSSGTLLWWSTTWVCWTTCLTSSAVCTESPAHTAWSPCPSASERVKPQKHTENTADLLTLSWMCLKFICYYLFSVGFSYSWPQVSTSSWTVTSPRKISGFGRPHWSSKWLRRPMRRRWRDSGTTRSVRSANTSSFPHSPPSFLRSRRFITFFTPCWWADVCRSSVSRNEEDDGRVHAGDQSGRVHGLWDHGDAGRER